MGQSAESGERDALVDEGLRGDGHLARSGSKYAFGAIPIPSQDG
jgi:hypothetical protein